MATQQEIARLIITLEGQVKELKKNLDLSTKEINKFGKKNESIFKNIRQHWLGYSAAIAGVTIALKSLTAPFAEFTHKMLEVRTLTNLSNKAFNELSQTIRNMTHRIPQSARELANALYDIVSAGVEVGQSAKVLELSAKAAIAGVTNTKTAAKAGLAVINAYGLGIEKLSSVYDLLFKTVKLGVLTFEDLSGAIGTVLPIARAANVDFQDIAASIATLTKQGIETRRATTFLRSAITALSAPTKEARGAMGAMGITWEGWIPTLRKIHERGLDLKQMRALIPDIRAGQAVIALAQNFEQLEDAIDEMGDSKGAMQNAYNIMKNSPVNQTKLLSNAVDDLKISLAAAFAPVVLKGVRALANELRRVSLNFKGYSTEQINLMNKIDEINGNLTLEYKDQLKELQKIRKEIYKEYRAQFAEVQRLKEAGTPYGAEILKGVDKRLRIIDDAILDLVNGHRKGLEQIKQDSDTETKGTLLDKDETKAKAESIKIFEAEVKNRLQELSSAFDKGKISIENYYDAQRLLVEASYNEQIRVLRDLIPKLKEEQDIREAQDQISVLLIEKQMALNRLKNDEINATKELTDERKKLQDLLTQIESEAFADPTNEYARKLAEIKEHERETYEAIDKMDLTETEKKKARQRAYTLWRIREDNLLAQHELEMSIKRQEMAKDAASSISSSFDSLYRSTGEKVKAFFVLSKAAALAEAIINMNLGMTKALAQGGIWGEAMAAVVALSAGINIANIMSQTIQGLASGGEVEGPSGVDKVPIRATKGEYVQRKSAVDYYGKGVMEALNRRAVPVELFSGYSNFTPKRTSGFFAEGGMVTDGVEQGTSLQINNIVDPALMGQYLASKPGQDMILNVISDNAYNIKTRLSL